MSRSVTCYHRICLFFSLLLFPRPVWNALDGQVDRKGHGGLYPIEDGRPLNLQGRTGLRGRGVLGRWGPNHAADPIVTRWQRDAEGEIVRDAKTGRGILEFVSIERKDNGGWAIPGEIPFFNWSISRICLNFFNWL